MDWLEEYTTGRAQQVLVNSRFTGMFSQSVTVVGNVF